MINAGILRESIMIQKLTTTQDEYGDVIQTYTDYLPLRASVKYAGGAKSVENFETWNSQTVVFTTYIRNIDETMRIKWKDNIYIINSKPLINYDYLEIYAEKLKN